MQLLQMLEEFMTIMEERRLTDKQEKLDKIITEGVKQWQEMVTKHKK